MLGFPPPTFSSLSVVETFGGLWRVGHGIFYEIDRETGSSQREKRAGGVVHRQLRPVKEKMLDRRA